MECKASLGSLHRYATFAPPPMSGAGGLARWILTGLEFRTARRDYFIPPLKGNKNSLLPPVEPKGDRLPFGVPPWDPPAYVGGELLSNLGTGKDHSFPRLRKVFTVFNHRVTTLPTPASKQKS